MLRVFRLGWLSIFSFSFSFFAGIIYRVMFFEEYSLYLFCVAFFVALVLIFSQRIILLVCGTFLLGFSYAGIYSHIDAGRILNESLDGKESELSGYIVDFPRVTERGWQFDFYSEELGGKVRLGLDSDKTDSMEPAFDCRYTLSAKLHRPRGLLNFSAYDYQAWLLQAGYLASGYVRSIQGCEHHKPSLILEVRLTIAEWIKSSGVSEYAKSTLLGLLIGSYADIDSAQWRMLRNSGTIHLLSVSGLHIVLVATLAHFCTRKIVCFMVFPLRWLPADWWAGCVAIFFSLFYSMLAGFSVATQRSLVMVFVAVLQRFLYGRFYFGSGLVVSIVLVALINPLSILSSSFWFSFVATGILLLAGYGYLNLDLSKIMVSFFYSVRLQCLIFILMMPVMLYVYGKLPLLSLPMNFIAVPWVSFITLPLAFLATLVAPFSRGIADLILGFSGWTLDAYWVFMKFGIELGQHWQLSMGGNDLAVVMLCIVGLSLIFLLPSGMPLRLAGMFLCLPMLFPQGLKLSSGEADVTVLDVGQGLGVVIRTARHALVYDVGDKKSERFDAGRDVVAVALRNMRVGKIDMLIVSHADSDHAGGRNGLLQEVSASQLWSGTPEQLGEEKPYLPCRAGMQWRWDGVSFKVLWPDFSDLRQDNNRGCVVLMEAGNKRLLLTADIEKHAEAGLLKSGSDLHADALLAPHHGSKSSSSSEFLDAINASVVIVSAGFNNRFHHPSPSVVHRYIERGMTVFNTADIGAVRLRLSENAMDIESALCQHTYFWRIERYNAHCR